MNKTKSTQAVPRNIKGRKIYYCSCGNVKSEKNIPFCSTCTAFSKRKFNISKEELEILVWKYPTTEVAKQLGVADTSIGKRCKLLGIVKPYPGYWAKKKYNKL